MPKDNQQEKILLAWRAAEFKKKPKSIDWFFGIGVVAIALMVWAIYTLNLMFFLVVLVATIALFVAANRKPKTYHFKISDSGIWIEKKFLPFQTLASFWIFDFPDTKILSLKSKNRLSIGNHFLIPKKKVQDLRRVLSQYLSEEEESYSLIDWLSDWLGF